MRFRRLRFDAFGPFSQRTLDFRKLQAGGVHVIFGPNEAGKSTALRGVRDLLYGMPDRTPDAHLHPTTELSIFAEVEAADGRRLVFSRKKKRKDSLRDAHDAPLPEEQLLAFLGTADASSFETLFGLDHERLKLGGQALLEGQGDIGQSLFDAGTGGRSVHAVLARLQAEAQELFKPAGRNQLLPMAVAAYRQAKKSSRDAVRVPQKWLEQQSRLDEVLARRDALRQERRSLQEEKERLTRTLHALTPAAKRRELVERRRELGDFGELPPDVGQRRQRLAEALLECRRERGRIERDLDRRRVQIGALPGESSLLSVDEERMGKLRDDVGIHRKAARDLPKREGELRAGEQEIFAILKRMGRAADIDQAERLRLPLAEESRVRRLARERSQLGERREGARLRLTQTERALAEAERQLTTVPESAEYTVIEQRLSGAHHLLERSEEVRRLEQRTRELRQERGRRLAELGASASHIESVPTPSLPAPALVRSSSGSRCSPRHSTTWRAGKRLR